MSAISTTRRSWSLAPAAGVAGGAQCGGKFGRFALKLELSGAEGFQLLGKCTVGVLPFLFDLDDFFINAIQGFFQRFDQRIDRLLARAEIAVCFYLKLRQCRLR